MMNLEYSMALVKSVGATLEAMFLYTLARFSLIFCVFVSSWLHLSASDSLLRSTLSSSRVDMVMKNASWTSRFGILG